MMIWWNKAFPAVSALNQQVNLLLCEKVFLHPRRKTGRSLKLISVALLAVFSSCVTETKKTLPNLLHYLWQTFCNMRLTDCIRFLWLCNILCCVLLKNESLRFKNAQRWIFPHPCVSCLIAASKTHPKAFTEVCQTPASSYGDLRHGQSSWWRCWGKSNRQEK